MKTVQLSSTSGAVRPGGDRAAAKVAFSRPGRSFVEPKDLDVELRSCVELLRTELAAAPDRPLARWCRWADEFIAGDVDGSRAGVESINAHLETLAHVSGSRGHRLAAAAEVLARAVFDAVTREEESARRHARTARQLLS
jgi:hypothetical protein